MVGAVMIFHQKNAFDGISAEAHSLIRHGNSQITRSPKISET
jgi:hypothetical protein